MDSHSFKKNKKKTTVHLLSIEDYIQNTHGSSSNSQKIPLIKKIFLANKAKKVSDETKPLKFNKAILIRSEKLLDVNPQKYLHYLTKPHQYPIFEMESSWIDRYSSLDECLQDVLSPNFQFMPSNLKRLENIMKLS